MFEFGSDAAVLDAGLLIGVVLLEAIVLYLGYGAAERLLRRTLLKRITNA